MGAWERGQEREERGKRRDERGEGREEQESERARERAREGAIERGASKRARVLGESKGGGGFTVAHQFN